jgi:AcrR family transcriptional regulator
MTVEHSGGGEPDRSLAMLWRARQAAAGAEPARGRRPMLTLDKVVTAAMALADSEGLQAMSMHGVAKSLGVGSMTLYTYVPAKAELIDLMVDQALSERALPGPGEQRPDGWRAEIVLYAEETLAVFHRHLWLRQVSTIRPPLGPGMMAGWEYLLCALAGIGLTPRQVTATADAIMAFVNSAASREADDVHVERTTGKSQVAWWQERQSFWEKYFDGERYPTMVELWDAGGFDDEPAADDKGDSELFGLGRMLDGVQALIDQNTRPT